MTLGWIAPLFVLSLLHEAEQRQDGYATRVPPHCSSFKLHYGMHILWCWGQHRRLGSLSKHLLISRESQVNIRNRKSKPNITLFDYQIDDTLREHTVSTERHSPGLLFGVNIGPLLISSVYLAWPTFLLSKVWCIWGSCPICTCTEDAHDTHCAIKIQSN